MDPVLPTDPLPAALADSLNPGVDLPRLDPALAEVAPDRTAELIDEIKLSADKLAKDLKLSDEQRKGMTEGWTRIFNDMQKRAVGK